ncbi:hypothetical protein SPI_06628 [Niveomyces insectorum RCEF 264]|uniref:Pre-rRNA-processing protein RIX1 n=1 Tax=Niveomyces insectorum RCEF 264 TaxID=1081102 RepID=A0A167RG00_9HYPO|nr:hypothetical protein SPI_06628 [Niveomyces insectorum RCEF 264]
MSSPPDLRVVCRKLAAAAPADLPGLCPSLVNHILRCSGPLSASVEQHSKNNASEVSGLVHKLKTQVSTLIQARNAQGRFAGMVLAKAIIDVGGWECLRTSEPWTQKPDPFASRELCVVVLARIYTLLQAYPTLVREIATPTIQTFASACLQLLRPAALGGPPKVPMHVVETVIRALATLVPLYPTTLRPLNTQIRGAIRAYIAPTASDHLVVPPSLRQSARHLLILLHYTAPKNGNADEWLKLLNSLIQNAHATADQVFRAVRESREPGSGFVAGPVSYDGEPKGAAGDGPDELPAWVGLQSGAERLVGLIETIGEFFRCSTKLPVAVPLMTIAGLVSRLSMVLTPVPGTPERDVAFLVNPSIGREERDELWGMLPNIHLAALRLSLRILERLGIHTVPLAHEILEDALRMFSANRRVPQARRVAYLLLERILPLIGPSLARTTVDALGVVIDACCQDLLEASGFAQQLEQAESKPIQGKTLNGPKSKPALANADLFLTTTTTTTGSGAAGTRSATSTKRLDAAHRHAAQALLAVLLVHLPQQHVKKADRALMDRTAILSADKTAMVASVLQPYIDQSGRHFANTIPFLARAYPHDIDMEVLRSNLRTAPHYFGNVFAATAPGEDDASDEDDDDDEDEDASMTGGNVLVNGRQHASTTGAGNALSAADAISMAEADTSASGGFAFPTFSAERAAAKAVDGPAAGVVPAPAPAFEPLMLKRKTEEHENVTSPPKRLDTGKTVAQTGGGDGDGSGDDSDGSVQLEMVFDGDEDSSEDD